MFPESQPEPPHTLAEKLLIGINLVLGLLFLFMAYQIRMTYSRSWPTLEPVDRFPAHGLFVAGLGALPASLCLSIRAWKLALWFQGAAAAGSFVLLGGGVAASLLPEGRPGLADVPSLLLFALPPLALIGGYVALRRGVATPRHAR